MIEKDFVADYGAPTDGTSSAITAFQNQFADIQGELAVISVPNHNYVLDGGAVGDAGGGYFLFRGVADLTLNGEVGATFEITASYYHMGGAAVLADYTNNETLIETANAGENWCYFLDLDMLDIVVIGDTAMICSGDTQGWNGIFYGWPPNNFFVDFVIPVAVDFGTGKVTFDRALRSTHLSTMPNFNNGMGNPATYRKLDPTFNTRIVLNNISIDQPGTYQDCCGIYFEWNGGTNVGNGSTPSGTLLTASEEIVIKDRDEYPSIIEYDKLMGKVTLVDYRANVHQWQSTGANMLHMERCIGDATSWIGGRYTSIVDCDISAVIVGPSSFNRNDMMVMLDNTDVDYVYPNPTLYDGGWGQVGANSGVNNQSTITAGVMSFPKGCTVTAVGAGAASRVRLTVNTTEGLIDGKHILGLIFQNVEDGIWPYFNQVWTVDIIDGTHVDLVGSDVSALSGKTFTFGMLQGGGKSFFNPGTYAFFGDILNRQVLGFKVLDVYEEGNQIKVVTDRTELNDYDFWSWNSGVMFVCIHPSPRFTARRNVNDYLEGYEDAPPGTPFMSRNRGTVRGSSTTPYSYTSMGWQVGTIKRIILDVVTPYTGSVGTYGATLGNWGQIRDENYDTAAIDSYVNLRIAGTREWSLGVGWTGTQSGDSLSNAYTANHWYMGAGALILFTSDIATEVAGTPALDFELLVHIETDQGLFELPKTWLFQAA